MMKLVALLSVLSALSASAFAPPSKGQVSSSLCMSSALIVQNKGGGHGELGFQLAKNLMNNEKISSITILQDDACNDSKEPFKSYASDLKSVNVVKAPLGDDLNADQMKSHLGGATFDYVWDNASKKPSVVLECSKEWGVKLHTYVSSAGIYLPGPDGPFPMPETTTVKEGAGQNLYDQAAVDAGFPYVSFRPQYIYGPKANKYDYLDWFFDRLVRELPLPIPGDGTQLVSLTNSEDVASLLASPLNNEEAAVQQRFFNCGTDQLVSYGDLAMFCAAAAGISSESVNLFYYDAAELGKAQFPFRPTNFYVAPDMAKEKLGWPGASHDLVEDLKSYYEGYKARGGLDKKLSLSSDWEITCGRFTPIPEYVSSIYEKYDPLVLET
mmetsp:Transcript_27097/g.74718  ORF Transcript_27097/g.74718 Transcript_27097/m.74718 type:complete len:383 (+) Transcript_27097:48-1196(+)